MPVPKRPQPSPAASTTYVYVGDRATGAPGKQPEGAAQSQPPAAPAVSPAPVPPRPVASYLPDKASLGPVVPASLEIDVAATSASAASAPESMLEALARVSMTPPPSLVRPVVVPPAARQQSTPPSFRLGTAPLTSRPKTGAPSASQGSPSVRPHATALPLATLALVPPPVVPPPLASPTPAIKVSAPAQDITFNPFLGLLDDVIDALDDGFDLANKGTGDLRTEALTTADLQAVGALFANIAATHMRPVRDFMIELKLADPAKDWIDVVSPAVASLRRSAEGMGLAELGEAVGVFHGVLNEARASVATTITDVQRATLAEAYAKLVALMPEAFGLDEERDRREPIIVQTLLRQVPEVRKVALDKLYAAGLTSLGMYYVAKPYDIAQAAGLTEMLAARIIERFARYREEASRAAPDAVRSRELHQLEDLVRRLEEQNDEFEAASRSASRDALSHKRRLRTERNETVLAANLVLARIGAVALVKELEKLPFQAKAEAIEQFVAEALKDTPGGRISGKNPR